MRSEHRGSLATAAAAAAGDPGPCERHREARATTSGSAGSAPALAQLVEDLFGEGLQGLEDARAVHGRGLELGDLVRVERGGELLHRDRVGQIAFVVLDHVGDLVEVVALLLEVESQVLEALERDALAGVRVRRRRDRLDGALSRRRIARRRAQAFSSEETLHIEDRALLRSMFQAFQPTVDRDQMLLTLSRSTSPPTIIIGRSTFTPPLRPFDLERSHRRSW